LQAAKPAVGQQTADELKILPQIRGWLQLAGFEDPRITRI
jgi:predicted GH43/DUF377 family glycosyl hydrolase